MKRRTTALSLQGRLQFFFLYTLPTKLTKVAAMLLRALFPEIPHVEIYLENISPLQFYFMKVKNAFICTEAGPRHVREHLEICGEKSGGETWVYKCTGCGAVCCQCFGGAPDIRCDDCVAGDEDNEQPLLLGDHSPERPNQQVH